MEVPISPPQEKIAQDETFRPLYSEVKDESLQVFI